VVVGLGAALALSSVLQSLLYGVPPRDPLALASVAAVILVVTACAGPIPARRALGIDPAVVLRDQ
jgi:ABC-type lipoprotein release transport system permease subunit